MQIRYTQTAKNALNKSLEIARQLGHTYIGSEHVLLGLLSEGEGVAAKIISERGITYETALKAIEEMMGTGEATSVTPGDMTPRTKRIIENSAREAQKYGQNYIGTEHILLALISETDCVAVRVIAALGVSARDLAGDIIGFFRDFAEPGGPTEDGVQPSAQQGPARQTGGVSGGLGGCPTLKQYGRDLTEQAKAGKLDPIIGRDTETERLIQILSRRTKNNPCLIGEAGVGKTAVVEGLAQRITEGNVPETLEGKHIVTLDIPGMIAGAKYRGEFEERMKGIMAEVTKNNSVILFIDEIHTIIGAGAAEGAVDAANILKPALARSEIQVIGATTIEEYRRHIEKDAALERRFQSVMVGEPTAEEAILILNGLRDKYEAHHKVKISDEAIEAAVRLSRRYINDRYLPDKAIDLIDEAASRLRISNYTAPGHVKELEEKIKNCAAEKEAAVNAQNFEKAAALRDDEKAAREAYEKAKAEWEQGRGDTSLVVGEDEIAEIVTAWTSIPVKKLAEEESSRLLNLGAIMRERIIGQDEAVDAVARAIRRGRVGLRDPRRPTGSFIFLGPTGVGKTELTKALADIMFGDPNAMIRIDMSEYMEKHSVSKLIGSPPGYVGYDEGGQLTEKIRRHPYSVMLFDEIEKAHPDVFNILLQILEDGILTDAQGRKVDFKNTVIIMTSNVGGAGLVSKSASLGFSLEVDSKKNERDIAREKVMAQLKDTFRPEFLNRVDEIIVFNKLTDEDIAKIARIMLAEVKTRVAAAGIDIEFGDDVATLMAKEGFDPVYGARPLRREIQKRIEDSFATEMLEGKVKKGDSVTASVEDGNVVYTVAEAVEPEKSEDPEDPKKTESPEKSENNE
ncbi:MAG: ATP-dependent Clp protease ATP-binding subunit [Eubacteriales bacterium]|nr:ATP-dependent Clp protease ATP-binding subunit [Eubacteriales bacterium]